MIYMHMAVCCTVLYCTVLYCTALYSTLPYSTLLYSTLLFCTPPLLLDDNIAVSHVSHVQLGNKDEALSNYIASLHVYEAVSGKQSPSYISTLANLGELFNGVD